MPFWVILVAVVLGLTLTICCLVCFTVRCFAPEQTVGPQWVTSSDGKPQYVRSGTRGGRWVQTYERDDSNPPDVYGEASIYKNDKSQRCSSVPAEKAPAAQG